MKKGVLAVLVPFAAIALLAPGYICHAQSLGELRKNAKSALNKVADKKNNAATATLQAKGAVANPIAEAIEVIPVGLYGVSTSENFGNVYLMLDVKMNLNKQSATFGSSIKNQKMIAVDENGKVYNIDSSGAFRYDTPEGITARIVLDNPDLMFKDVKKSVKSMKTVKLGIHIDAANQGNITISDIPIQWDVTQEQQ